MFEDQPKSAGGPPANLPTEPVDMFAGVEESAEVAPPKMPDALSSGLLKRKVPKYQNQRLLRLCHPLEKRPQRCRQRHFQPLPSRY